MSKGRPLNHYSKRETSRRSMLESLARQTAELLRSGDTDRSLASLCGLRHARIDPVFDEAYLDELGFLLDTSDVESKFTRPGDRHFFRAYSRNVGGRPDHADLIRGLELGLGAAERHLVAIHVQLFELSERDASTYFAALARAQLDYEQRYGADGEVDPCSPDSLASTFNVDIEHARAAVFPAGLSALRLRRALRTQEARAEAVAAAFHECESREGLVFAFRFIVDATPSVSSCIDDTFVTLSPEHRVSSEQLLMELLRDGLSSEIAACFEPLVRGGGTETEVISPIRRAVDYLDRLLVAYTEGHASAEWLLAALDHHTAGPRAIASYRVQECSLSVGREVVLERAQRKARQGDHPILAAALADVAEVGSSAFDHRIEAEIEEALGRLERVPEAERLGSRELAALRGVLGRCSTSQRRALHKNRHDFQQRMRHLGETSHSVRRDFDRSARNEVVSGTRYRVARALKRARDLLHDRRTGMASDEAVLRSLAALGNHVSLLASDGGVLSADEVQVNQDQADDRVHRVLSGVADATTDQPIERYPIVRALVGSPDDDDLLRDALRFYFSTAIALREALVDEAPVAVRSRLGRSFQAARRRFRIATHDRKRSESEHVDVFMLRLVEESGCRAPVEPGAGMSVFSRFDEVTKRTLSRELSVVER